MSLNSIGGVRIEQLESARDFCERQLQELRLEDESETLLQKQLLKLLESKDQTYQLQLCPLAALCLRCFISHRIHQSCLQLAAQFGKRYGFTSQNLLPYVLTDILRQDSSFNDRFIPLGVEILSTFDSERGSLSAWITRKVRHHQPLNQFLLEQGVYLISDWAILNDTTAKQLERILIEFYHFPPFQIRRAVSLLNQYHQIYRQARLQKRSGKSRSPCLPPTPLQLQQIAAIEPELKTPPEKILKQLQNLADLLRQYRIYIRGGKYWQGSLDDHETGVNVDKIPSPTETELEREQEEFLSQFRQEVTQALDQAIAHVIQQRMTRFQQKNAQKAEDFRKALHLLHCQGQVMIEIAPQVNLQHQYQVSRLLMLDQLRADVRRFMVCHLRDFIFKHLELDRCPEQLQKIDQALEEFMIQMTQTAAVEVTHTRGHPLKSLFAQRLCRYLKQTYNDC